jgi:hypothetical protein
MEPGGGGEERERERESKRILLPVIPSTRKVARLACVACRHFYVCHCVKVKDKVVPELN